MNLGVRCLRVLGSRTALMFPELTRLNQPAPAARDSSYPLRKGPKSPTQELTHGMASAKAQTHVTHSAEETVQLGVLLAREMKPPQLILLIGELGCGKTTLAKGLISGIGAASANDVLSPSFSLIHEYDGDPKVYHIDLYRLDRLPELETLGLDDLWDQQAIVLIEWGEKFAGQLPESRIEIQFKDLGESEREIRVRSAG